MKVFGPRRVNAMVEAEQVPRPAYPCIYCDQAFAETDSGFVTPYASSEGVSEAAYHLRCLQRALGVRVEPRS